MASICIAACTSSVRGNTVPRTAQQQGELAARNDAAKLAHAREIEGKGGDETVEAKRSYREIIAGPVRYDTLLIPADGQIISDNAAIGPLPFWPRSANEIQFYSPSRIEAIFRLCGIDAGSPECRADRLSLLLDLASLEGNFTACRIRANWGGAGPNPYSYWFGIPADFDRRIETRHCIFTEPIPETFSPPQMRTIWLLWLALDRLNECKTGKCRERDALELLKQVPDEPMSDSLTYFARRDALGKFPSMPDEVGDVWWLYSCRSFRIKDDPPPRPSEQAICSLIHHRRDWN